MCVLHLCVCVCVCGYSRLRCVQRVRAVPDVLGAVEDPEGQAGQEVPGGEVPRHGPDGEP